MHEFRPVVEAIARITTSTKGKATCWAHIPTMTHTKGMTTSFLENLHLWQARVIYVCKCMFKNILIGTKWNPKVGLLHKKYMMCVYVEFSLVLQKLRIA